MITFFQKKKDKLADHIIYDMRDKNQFIQWRFQIIVNQFCLKKLQAIQSQQLTKPTKKKLRKN